MRTCLAGKPFASRDRGTRRKGLFEELADFYDACCTQRVNRIGSGWLILALAWKDFTEGVRAAGGGPTSKSCFTASCVIAVFPTRAKSNPRTVDQSAVLCTLRRNLIDIGSFSQRTYDPSKPDRTLFYHLHHLGRRWPFLYRLSTQV